MTRYAKKTRTPIALAAVAVFTVAAPRAAGANVTGQQITDAVAEEMLEDAAVPYNDIQISTTDGVVTLTGEVDNLLAKVRAERLAQTVRGVQSVVNRIAVAPEEIPDRRIRKNIEDALLADPATESYEVEVAVRDGGRVVLTGTVESWRERELVEKVAMGVKGIRSVDNRIDIHYPRDRSDYAIDKEVERALRWDALVDAMLIRVHVEDGEVQLSGTVGSAAEKRRAKTVAWGTGVESVDASDLEVADWAADEDLRKREFVPMDDGEIYEAVESALLIDPRVNSLEVKTTVYDGVVTLRGTVDTLKAKRSADADAWNTTGVSWVKNLLRVRPSSDADDEAIASNVRNALVWDPYTEKYEIDVSVDDGVVDLEGTVDTWYEKARAGDLAARTAGVTVVENDLLVDTTGYLSVDPYLDAWYIGAPYSLFGESRRVVVQSDAHIEREIESELVWSPFVDADEVEVEVVDGVAELDGVVDSYREVNAASQNALEGGAYRVLNNLTVEQDASS